jgi:Holliday junction DNA helicase RuvA
MIRTLSGILRAKERNFAIVEVGGIGFKVFVSLRTQEKLPAIGEAVTFSTYLYVKEDALELFGFIDGVELSCFEALISVSGIGPRLAMAILAVAPAEELITAIANGNSDVLDRAAGIGRKTAERIILELKDKMKLVSKGGGEAGVESNDDVYEALRSLGYSSRQASSAIAKIDPQIRDVGARLRDALRKMKS